MTYVLIIVLAPAAAGLWVLLGQKKAGYLSLLGATVSLLASGVLYYSVAAEGYLASRVFAGLPDLPFRLMVTFLVSLLSLMLAVISALIFLYAIGYMNREKGATRFWFGMCLFLSSMQLLLFAGDWILFVSAWELMGFASYLLISTRYWQGETGPAANKAFAINRFADLGLYIGVFIIILSSGSSQVAEASTRHISHVGAAALLLAVMGKSAQVPFQSWLASAMKGPTPVSALLHSATMVAAGIVLLLKAYPLLPPAALTWTGIAGGITVLLSGLTAVFSEDIKRLLAASSSSQLGFMLLAAGAGFPGAALAHLLAHAFMKSSLFLGAGIYQHASDSTSFDKLAGAGKKLKLPFAGFALAAVALAGLPPLVGFWSKDAVLSAGLKSTLAPWYFPAALAGTFLTALYMGRATGILWKGDEESSEAQPPAGLRWMQTGLGALVLWVLAGGLFLHKIVEMAHYHLPKAEPAKIGGLVATVVGLIGGWLVAGRRLKHAAVLFIRRNYPVGGGYRTLVGAPLLKLARWCRLLDESLHQMVLKTGHTALGLSGRMQKAETGIHRQIFAVGRFLLELAGWSRNTDERGIEEIISNLTDNIQKLGRYGRRIQSGLVHQELLWSVFGMVAFVIIMFTTLL